MQRSGLEALYVLAVNTEMRPGKLLGLKWEDVDLNTTDGSLRVNRALSEGKLATTKTKRSRRRIDLSAGSAAALKAYHKRRLEERMQKARLWWDHGLVFPQSWYAPLAPQVVRAFKELLKRAGLPIGTRLYDHLRHIFATLLLNSNVHPKYVQELLGHASI